MNTKVKILGLDPGSRVTGYGLLELDTITNGYCYLVSGCIKAKAVELGGKLLYIYEQVKQLVQNYQPHEIAIERVFMKKNPDSAIKLGQARGVAIAAALSHGASLAEYSPRVIKQAVVGYGNADKNQVQTMVKLMLQLPPSIDITLNDESDALAIAICHAHSRKLNQLASR